jgi:hypothetical protein
MAPGSSPSGWVPYDGYIKFSPDFRGAYYAQTKAAMGQALAHEEGGHQSGLDGPFHNTGHAAWLEAICGELWETQPMNISVRRALQCALLASGACILADPLGAQQTRLTPAAVGQIVDEVLNVLGRPDSSLSRVPIGKRKIYFDHARTLTAFKAARGLPTTPADLRLRTSVNSGTQSLLDDCSQFRARPCQHLGWGVYAWVEPVSVTTTEAVVRAIFLWPDRGPDAFEERIAPTGPASLVGYNAEIHLARAPGGRWKFVRLGPFLVGE